MKNISKILWDTFFIVAIIYFVVILFKQPINSLVKLFLTLIQIGCLTFFLYAFIRDLITHTKQYITERKDIIIKTAIGKVLKEKGYKIITKDDIEKAKRDGKSVAELFNESLPNDEPIQIYPNRHHINSLKEFLAYPDKASMEFSLNNNTGPYDTLNDFYKYREFNKLEIQYPDGTVILQWDTSTKNYVAEEILNAKS